MSLYLKDYIGEFMSGKITANDFCDNYMSEWKQERDNNILRQDEERLSELLSSVFCLADMYNPDDDREEYEFSGDQLWNEVNKLIQTYMTE